MLTAPLPKPGIRSRGNVTVADIAKTVGLSQSTVSHVLNGNSKKYRIADKTARRIEQAAAELHYVPNGLARWLRRGQTGEVGVVLPHLRNNWADQIMVGVERVLDEVGLMPLIVHHRESVERSRRGLASLMERRVSGVICSPMPDEAESYRKLQKRDIPVVFVGDRPSNMPEARLAAWDPVEISMPVSHLIDAGCRRILLVEYDEVRPLNAERLGVAIGTIESAGLPTGGALRIKINRERGPEPAVREAFAGVPEGERPDAVFTLYDDVALRIIYALNELGLRVPGDVTVAATGTTCDQGLIAAGLNVLMQAPVANEGEAATRMLLEQLDRLDAGNEQRFVRGGRLMVDGQAEAGSGHATFKESDWYVPERPGPTPVRTTHRTIKRKGDQ